MLRLLPLLVAAFLIAGLVEVLVPREWITGWLGQEAGHKGILVASALGTVSPVGLCVSFPIAASIYRAGAGMGSMVAYVSAW
ncbi:MAG: permease, partial [Dehalococcoidia bacterium]|nr:permease [Dehalococcoidia bacterium]